ncbi:extracellular solute-binding protein [Alisedimentitalea sp. MJ-SS2]|uniref:extracellular solute-binding protein n=1 Tax=Aliisedimentitalea sp. MJ-SS2 TaxID=3049795 RepID=UPI002911179C|nr:extracellular solute-binding protein [Alisedimentitalea sp. MJ-SS2]MDU8928109.1 extracellular solute-binding protein [Alisedimentitalea sp. MJ-SS2]
MPTYSVASRSREWMALGLMIVTLALTWAAVPVKAEEAIIKSHGISTFGDLKYGADFKHFDYVNPDAPKGGEFSTWAFGTFDSLTPYILKGNAAAGSTVFYDSLMTGSMDEPDAMYGLLAHMVEYPENREWAIFHLRPEAKFSDGTQVTAEDVVFSYEVLREKGQPGYQVTFKDFESAEALDPLRVKFTFNPEGALRELIMTAAGLPVFSRAYYETRDFAESTIEPPLGSGAYALNEIKSGRTVSYKRRDDYWGKDLPVNVGHNNFDTLKFEYFADYTSAFEAFKGGAYVFREEFLSKLWATAYDFPAIQEGRVKVETLPDGRPAGTQGFFFNLRRDKFKDPKVRQAIEMAFNFEWSNQSLFYGIYTRTDSFWENSTLQAEGIPGPEELAILEPFRGRIPETVFTESAYVPAVSKARKAGDRKSLRAAAKLLDEAGWTIGDDGMRRNAKGEVLSVEILNDSPSFERIALPYIDNLQRLGIDASSERVDAAQSAEREKKFDFDMVTQRYAMSFTPGIELRGIFGSQSADLHGSNNIVGLKNEAVDELIEKIIQAKSREELDHTVKALDRVLRALHIWVPQWYKPSHNIAYFDMYERPYGDNPPPLALGEASIWWFNPEKAAKLKQAGALR